MLNKFSCNKAKQEYKFLQCLNSQFANLSKLTGKSYHCAQQFYSQKFNFSSKYIQEKSLQSTCKISFSVIYNSKKF